MQRRCDACGEPYEAKRPSSRYCSERCKRRAHRGQVVELPPAAAEPEPHPSGVLAATRTELDDAERTETALGQAALVLAARLDNSRDTGSALAALTKEWRSTLAAATEGVARVASPLDELRLRRESRRGA